MRIPHVLKAEPTNSFLSDPEKAEPLAAVPCKFGESDLAGALQGLAQQGVLLLRDVAVGSEVVAVTDSVVVTVEN